LASGKPADSGLAPQPKWQPSANDPTAAARFAIGDTVRVRNQHPLGHTRAPRYTRGHIGEIVAHDGPEPVPERAAENVCVAEHVYSVRFESAELWGPASGRHVVLVDLWESYLEPAT
jgi:nitrile hydratase